MAGVFSTPMPNPEFPPQAMPDALGGERLPSRSANALIVRAFAGTTIFIGVLVLIGWIIDVPELRALGPDGGAAMNPVAGLCFVLLGCSVWLIDQADDARTRTHAFWMASVVAAVGIARLYGLATGDSPGVDELLFGDALRATADGRSNRMSLNTAINLALLGGALLLQVRSSRVASALAQFTAVFVLFTAQSALIAHAYRSGWFNSIGEFNRMAVPSAVAFASLGIAVLAMSSAGGIIGIVLSDSPGGRLARILLPAGFLVPAVLGWIVIVSRRAGLIDHDLGDTLLVLGSILTFVVIVSWVATQLHNAWLERVRASLALRESETRFRLIAENSSDVIMLYGPDGRIAYASPSCERVLGFLPEEMPRMGPFATVHRDDVDRVVRHFNQLLRGDPAASIQVRMMHKTGRHLWLEMLWRAVVDDAGQVTQLQVSARDITESKQYERQLEEAQRKLRQQQDKLQEVNSRLAELATLDPLTQLRNRRAFQERLEDELRRSRRHGHPTSLVLLDIDHFKAFNDAFGHPAGDEVLRATGCLLRRTLRASDFAARYGGEEFAVILPDTDSPGAERMAERLREAIEGASWADRAITASVGVSTLGPDTASAEALVDQADRALYRSKEEGRNRVTLAGV